MTRLHRCALAVAASVLAASGCGAAESQLSAERATAAATTAVSLAPVSEADSVDDTTTTTATTTPIATEVDDCELDRTMLELAVEAYVARTGTLPTSQDDLVGDYLRVEITSHRLDPDGGVTRLGRVPCVLHDPGPPELSSVDLRSVDEWLWFLGDEFVDDTGGLECATEVARILVALTAFEEREGREPVDLDELAGDLEAPLELWAFDADADAIVPADGSGCIDWNQVEPEVACETQRRTLEVAIEVYESMQGVLPLDQDALLDEELIRERASDFEIVDGAVAALPGTECSVLLAELDTAEPGPFTQADCDVDFFTLSDAIDAYVAATERFPDNERQLVDAGFIRDSSRMWDVVYGDLVPADGSGCEYPVG